jgi:hypothetical protein
MGHRHTDPFLAQPPDTILAALAEPRVVPASPPAAFHVRRRGPGRIRVDDFRAFVLYRRARNDSRAVVAAWRERLPREARGRPPRSGDATVLKTRRAASGPLREALTATLPGMADALLDRLVESVVESGPERERGADIRVDVLRDYVGSQLGVSRSTIRDAVAAAGSRHRQWARFLRWVAAEHSDRGTQPSGLTRVDELWVTAMVLEQWRGQWPGKVPPDFLRALRAGDLVSCPRSSAALRAGELFMSDAARSRRRWAIASASPLVENARSR